MLEKDFPSSEQKYVLEQAKRQVLATVDNAVRAGDMTMADAETLKRQIAAAYMAGVFAMTLTPPIERMSGQLQRLERRIYRAIASGFGVIS
jgi:hypothetical protein